MNDEPNIGKVIFTGLAALLALIIFFRTYEPVAAGEVKVVRSFGQTVRVLQPGLNWINPFSEDTIVLPTRLVIYETTVAEKQKDSNADYKDYPVDTNTSDGQQVDVSYTVRFAIDGYKAQDVVNRIGNMDNVVERIVKTESRIVLRNVPREFTAEELYTGDGVQKVQTQVEEHLRPVFEANGLHLDSIGVREIKFAPQYVQAIESKQIELVKVQTAENIAARAEFEKQATIRQAEAEAEAQRLQGLTLTSDVIEKLALEVERIKAEALKISAEKGASIVPTTIVGSDVPVWLGFPQQ